MSASRILSKQRVCPTCQHAGPLIVQFKYGDTRMHDYRIGDRLVWGGNDEGVPGRHRVVVGGFAEPCVFCGYDPDVLYQVDIRDDAIVAVHEAGRLQDEFALFGPEGHRVLPEVSGA